MESMLQISIGMFTNLMVTLGCVFLVTRTLPYLSRRPARLRALILGALFGATAIASMMTAFPISPGIYGDMRNAIIAIACFSGGPLAAVFCAAIAVIFRFALGGQYVGAISAILACAALAIAFQLSPLRKTKTNLALFGVALALVNALVPFVGWILGIAPFSTVVAVAEAIFGSAILIYPASIVLVASLVNSELRRLDALTGLRDENAQLSLQERRFASVFDLSCIPMAWIDLETKRFVRVNREYEDFSGYRSDELLQMTVDQLSVVEDEDTNRGEITALASGKRSLKGERRYRCKDGSVRWGSRTMTLSEQDGQAKFGFVIIEDITERKRDAEQIAYLAEHDHLTGLANRFQFGKNLNGVLVEDPNSPVAVIVFDLDDFKGVNDTRGHPIGDQVLIRISELLGSSLRPSDQAARIGGDEFAVTMQNATAPDALSLADGIIALIAQPFDIEEQPVSVHASAGIAIAPDDGLNATQLFKKADIALYASKAAGKNQAKLFEPTMEEALLRHETLKKQLLLALEHDEFEVEYQPVIDIPTGRVCRFEALLRWNHQAGVRISPAEFIPLAEQTGVIVAIGTWVLHQACLAATTWPRDVGVAVNVSVRQFDASLPLKIAAALARSGLSSARLEIEITESVLLQGNDDSMAILHEIRSLGVAISLDDFGTGYSSLSYLQRFPFQKLKIDKSFISGNLERSEARALVRSVIQLGHSLGMKVTAEGVETLEQLQRMRDKRCDEAQGFLFSPSVPAANVSNLIASLNQRQFLPTGVVEAQLVG